MLQLRNEIHKIYKSFLSSIDFKRIHQQQRGQILIMACILLLMSCIMIIPLAHNINTGLKTTRVYQRNTHELYAADRGIQYGMWKIKYDAGIIDDRANGIYNSYGPYTVPAIAAADPNAVSVQISANWLFYYLFRMPMGATPHNVNLITSCEHANGLFTINFTNTQAPDGPPVQPIVIDSMGVWLPPGFSYAGSPSGITTNQPTIEPVYGGTNLIWNDVGYNLGKYQSAKEQFSYTPSGSTPSAAASWVFPQQQSVGASWDNAIWWYDIISTGVDNSVSPSKTTNIKAVVVFDTETVSGLNLVTYNIGP